MRRWVKANVLVGLLAPMPVAADEHFDAGRHPGQNGALTDRELEIAQIAWTYFENNFQPETCLVNAVDDYPSTSVWDVASSIAALVSAFELGVITRAMFYERTYCLLHTLGTLELFQDELPNKAYDTRTAVMTDYANVPGEVGFSAMDVGRLLIWLRILKERHPIYAPAVNAVVSRWSFCNLLDSCGTMYGTTMDGADIPSLQEGRLGYEEYAAKGFQLWGFTTQAASKIEPVEFQDIYGSRVPADSRDSATEGGHNYVVTESYALDGVELNWDRTDDRGSNDMLHSDEIAADYANRIYKVQESRHSTTGILTARTEHQIDAAPWFVYDTIFSNGRDWNTITDEGTHLPEAAAVSIKAAFSLWALWDTPYTNLLFLSMVGQFDPDRGYYEGVYESSGEVINAFTANNNGIILEALLYKVEGKLLRFGRDESAPWVSPDESVVRSKCQVASCQRSPCGPALAR